MATYSIIKLSNFSPLHVGTGKDSYDSSMADLHSDTLTAALAAVRAQHGKSSDLDSFLQSVAMSSAFPYYAEHLMLPVPKGKLNVSIEGESEHQFRKMLKKVRYIDKSLWCRLISGEHLTLSRNQFQGDYIFNLVPSADIQISKSHVSERVSVPRDLDNKTEPFYFEWKYFDDNSGLYVLTDAQGKPLQELVQLFEWLGQEGIGTDRSVGGGKFDVQGVETWTFDEPTNINGMMLLSMYIPTEEELSMIDLDSSVYNISLRGGFIAGSQKEEFRHLRKKSVYMFDVGSVLLVNTELQGKVVNLRPDWNDEQLHPVYRSGRPLYVPIKVNL